MPLIRKTAIFLLIGFVCPSTGFSEGGKGVGNGGDVLVCVRGATTTVELYDFWEARALRPDWSLGLGVTSISVRDKLETVFGRLRTLSPDRAVLYRNTTNTILALNPFVDSPLDPVDDLNNSALLPAGCHIEQVAIHLFPQDDPQHREWVINRSLYDQMNNDSKAGLLLHEAIYAEMAQLGFESSNGVRFLNSVISSGDFASISLKEFVFDLLGAGMQSFEYQGLELRLDPQAMQDGPDMSNLNAVPLFYPSGKIKEGYVVSGSTYQQKNGQVIQVSGIAHFDENGVLKAINDSTH